MKQLFIVRQSGGEAGGKDELKVPNLSPDFEAILEKVA